LITTVIVCFAATIALSPCLNQLVWIKAQSSNQKTQYYDLIDSKGNVKFDMNYETCCKDIE
jgi:hypothetical protein